MNGTPDDLAEPRGHVARLVGAILPPRFWTLSMSLVAIGLGGLLLEGPARELPAIAQFRLQDLTTVGWFLTGACMLLGGISVLLRLASHRAYFISAVLCALPVAFTLGDRALTEVLRLRKLDPALRESVTNAALNGVQTCVSFFGVAVLLLLLLRNGPLRAMTCSRGTGTLGSAAVGAVQGFVLSLLLWLACRWVGFAGDARWLIQSVGGVPVHIFVGGGIGLGALIHGALGQRREATPLDPVSAGVAGALGGTGIGYVIWILCGWLAKALGATGSDAVDGMFVAAVVGGAVVFGFVAWWFGHKARERAAIQPATPKSGVASLIRKSGVAPAGDVRSVARSKMMRTRIREKVNNTPPATVSGVQPAVDVGTLDEMWFDEEVAEQSTAEGPSVSRTVSEPRKRPGCAALPGMESHLI